MDKIESYTRKMLKDRGYDADEGDLNDIFYSETNKIKVYLGRSFIEKKIGYYPNFTTFEIKTLVEEILKSIISESLTKTDIVIILPDEFTKKEITSDLLTDRMTIFSESEMKFDPTSNRYVPKHEKASQEELDEMENKHIKFEDLPVINAKDPICKWYGFKKGEVIRIDRDYSDEVFYRYVL